MFTVFREYKKSGFTYSLIFDIKRVIDTKPHSSERFLYDNTSFRCGKEEASVSLYLFQYQRKYHQVSKF